jgi:ADP-ribose pyrophosphatase YjhB (NUDIX family)
VCALIMRGDTALLVRQSKGAQTYWLLPGGALELGETLEEAVHREVQEECSIAMTLRGPLGVVESISPDRGRSRHVVHFMYAATAGPDAHALPSDSAILEVRWVTAREVGEMVVHPPIADLVVGWMDRLAAGEGVPPFVTAGARWVP